MNGYTTIKINNQEVGLRFAYPAIKWFAEASATNEFYFTPGEESNFTVDGLAKLLHCAYRNACLVKEVDATLTNEDFYNWVEQINGDDIGVKTLVDVLRVYSESSVMKKATEQLEKKSPPIVPLTSTPSNPSVTENLAGDPGNSIEPPSATSSLQSTG